MISRASARPRQRTGWAVKSRDRCVCNIPSLVDWNLSQRGGLGTLVHGYANPLTIRRFVKLAESPKVLKMLPYGRIRATRSRGMPAPRQQKKARPEGQASGWVGWNRIASTGCVPGLLGCREIRRGGFGPVGLALDQKGRERHGTGLRSVRAAPCPWVGQGQRRGGETRGAQHLRQPACAIEQALGFARHVALLEMLDQLRRGLALGLANRVQDLRLRDPPEIAVNRRRPVLRHVQAG